MASILLLHYYSPNRMERWAANTLRTLGIILTSGFVIIVGFLLILAVICSGASERSSSQFIGSMAVCGLLLLLGITLIARLSRRLYLSLAYLDPLPAQVPTDRVVPESDVQTAVPLHLSPRGRKAVDRVVLALGAQIVVSAAAWIFNQLHFWTGPRIIAPFPSNWLIALLVPFVFYHLPYAILMYVLLKRPDRRAFTYSLAVPAVLIMQAFVSLGYVSRFAQQHPISIFYLVIPWVIHIVILVLAYQAIQQVGLHPQPSSLIVAAIVSFFFFSFIQAATSFLYRFSLR